MKFICTQFDLHHMMNINVMLLLPLSLTPPSTACTSRCLFPLVTACCCWLLPSLLLAATVS